MIYDRFLKINQHCFIEATYLYNVAVFLEIFPFLITKVEYSYLLEKFFQLL